MEKFRWCFIGTGKLANKVAGQILDSKKHEIVSCFTRSYKKGLEFAEKYNCKAYENAIDAINDERVDGVYIVTTHNAHFRFAKLALENKKPVLLEKPFTVTASETKELLEIAKKNNTYILEAMWTWFGKAPHIVKKWLDEEKIGTIKKVKFTYNMKSINYAPRVSDPRRAGGALLDIGIYPITYAYKLWGKPISVKASGVIKNSIDESESITLSYANGLEVNITSSIVDMKGLEKLTIVGEKGTIVAPFYHFLNKVKLKKGLFKKEIYKSNPLLTSYVNEFDALVDDVKNNRLENEIVPHKQTLEIMEIIDEIAAQIGLVYDNLE